MSIDSFEVELSSDMTYALSSLIIGLLLVELLLCGIVVASGPVHLVHFVTVITSIFRLLNQLIILYIVRLSRTVSSG